MCVAGSSEFPVDGLGITVGQGIACSRTEIVLVPHIIARPPVLAGHEFTEALEGGNYGCSYLGTESPAPFTVSSGRGVGVFAEIITGVEGSPVTASTQSSGVGTGLEITVASVESTNVLGHPTGKRGFGCRFIVTTPYGYTGMVAYALDFFEHVVVESVQVIRQSRVGIDPEIVPDHDAVFVAVLVKLVIGNRTEPITNHIEIHVFMKPYPSLVFLPAAAQHIFRHAPIGSFDEYGDSVDVDVEDIAILVIGIFTDTERNVPGVGYFVTRQNFYFAVVQVGVSIPVGPPEFGTVDT